MQANELIIYLCIVLPIIPIIFAMREKYSKRFRKELERIKKE